MNFVSNSRGIKYQHKGKKGKESLIKVFFLLHMQYYSTLVKTFLDIIVICLPGIAFIIFVFNPFPSLFVFLIFSVYVKVDLFLRIALLCRTKKISVLSYVGSISDRGGCFLFYFLNFSIYGLWVNCWWMNSHFIYANWAGNWKHSEFWQYSGLTHCSPLPCAIFL